MHTTETPIDRPLHSDEHPERHEHSDLSVGPLMAVFAVGVLVVVFTLVGVYFLFDAFGAIDKRFLDNPPMTAIQTPRIQPNEPRIQGIPGFHTNLPWQDTQEMKQQTTAELGGFGTTNENNYVHIPIDQAMRTIVQAGSLKVRDNPNVPNQGGAMSLPSVRIFPLHRRWHFSATVLLALFLFTHLTFAYPEAPDYVSSNSQLLQKAGVDQKLDAQIPLDATFKDSTGATVKLGQYFQPGKPVVLSLVYYGCSMLCPMTLDGITKSLKELNTTAGKDFNVVFVSFNPKETPEVAAAKKLEYTAEYNRPGTEAGWHFLTGDETNINRLADAVGFRYFYDTRTQQYGHASAIMLLTPDGHMSRYFYGLEYAPEDLRLGLVEASRGKIGSLADAILLLCCKYDPTTGKYGLMVTRMLSIGGGVTILAVGAMIGFFVIRDKNKLPLKTGGGNSLPLNN